MPLLPEIAEDVVLSEEARQRLFPWIARDRLRGIPHLITPAWARDKSCFDPQGYADLWQKIGFDSVILLTVHHDGFYLYPSKFVRQKPVRDYFGEQIDACRKRNIRCLAYYSLSLNSLVGSEHPTWRIRDVKDRVIVPDHRFFFHYHWLCINSPFRDFAIAQMVEIAKGYPVDGIFLDIVYLPPHPPAAGLESSEDTCFCEHCHKAYSTWYQGEHLVEAIGSPRHDEFRAESYRRFFIDLKREIKAVGRSIAVSFNGAGRTRLPFYERVDELADWNTSEAHDPHSRGIYTRLLPSDKKPYELMSCSELVWSHNVAKPTPLLRLEAAATLIAGGTYTLGINHAPDGRLLKGNASRLPAFGKWCLDLAEAASGARQVAEIAVLLSGPISLSAGLRRWFDFLVQNHFLFRFVKNAGDLQGSKLWIFPTADLTPEKWELLIRHVREGGSAFINGPVSTATIPDVLALSCGGDPMESDCFYLQPSSREPARGLLGDDPVFFAATQASRLSGRDWQTFAHLVPPFARKERLTDIQIAPNFPLRSGIDAPTPGIVVRNLGKGRIAFSAFDLAVADPRAARNPWPKFLVGNCFRSLLGGSQIIQTQAPAAIEMVLAQKESTITLWLLNHRYDASEYIGGEEESTMSERLKIELDLRWLEAEATLQPNPNVEITAEQPGLFSLSVAMAGVVERLVFSLTPLNRHLQDRDLGQGKKSAAAL